jgi:pilus assembly protein Flp/PilA
MVLNLNLLLFHLKRCFLAAEGQDLVEYALVAALISLGAVAAMQSVASDIATTFSYLATTFNSRV